MSNNNQGENLEVFFIPPNFLTSGRLFGGMLRIRNAVEAGVLALGTAIPIIQLPFSLSTKIIIMCLTTLPLAVLGCIGIDGDSITEFLINWVRWLKKRACLQREGVADIGDRGLASLGRAASKPPAELGIELRQKPVKPNQRTVVTRAKGKRGSGIPTTESLIPIKNIRNGIVEIADGRYIKILEVEPINFLLRSPKEQRSIISSYASWLKISPVRLQIKVITKKADISKHLKTIEKDIQNETNPKCRELQEDYSRLIQTIGSREAITRRFLLIFEYEAVNNRRTDYAEIVSTLETAARTARQYFAHCDNEIVRHEDENAFLMEILYTIFNRSSSENCTLEKRVRDEQIKWLIAEHTEPLPLANCLAPNSIDFTHGSYVVIDGVYYAYLIVPSDGYNTRVVAGWTSMLVNAGEGIDIDFFFTREPKERIQPRLGQQIRINRSRIKDTSDTNSDFDDIDSAIQAGYYLKQGLSNYEDMYYGNILITVTADSEENLEWRVDEIKRLLVSQDMSVRLCRFRMQDAMMSSLPICSLDKNLYERSKRNMLTSAVASYYPFTSFEMSDENGILLGVNKHNNSLVIVDIFNGLLYKNANIAILGTSGAGKTFTLQLMALRMRRKGIQVFIIAPLKGHEMRRACKNIGGEFISISPASKQCINVMEIRKVDQTANAILDGGINDNSILAKKINQLLIFFELLIPDMTHEERQLLDEVLVRVYANKGITHDNNSLSDPEHPDRYREMPLLGDVYDLLIEAPETKRMGNILNRLVHGSAQTFNQPTNVQLDNPYTALDISELTGDLMTVGMFVCLDYVWDKVKEDRTKEKAIFIDEVWKLIGSGSNIRAAENVFEIFKTCRAYGASAICATQDLNDFFALEGGKYGRGILNNAKTKIILNLEDEEAARVQDTLHLTDAEMEAIRRFDRGTGLISTNSNHITVEFRASALEKELITTDRYDLSKLVEAEVQAEHHSGPQEEQ